MVENFRELNLDPSYFSGLAGADLVKEFYEPVLAKSAAYDRVAGYFSSAALAGVAKGIASFVKRGGKMRLVTSHAFTKGDITRIKDFSSATDLNHELIQSFEMSMETLDRLQNAIAKDHFSAMCWMLANNQLEIKVVIPRNADLSRLTPKEIEKFHPKFGLLYDDSENTIAFSGSINETWYAWTQNTENLDVYQSWLVGQDAYIEPKKTYFERYWEGTDDPNWLTIELPEAVKQKIVVDYAPDDFPASLSPNSKEVSSKFGLSRNYQNEAVSRWIDSGYTGILEMATGTGKTRTASTCIREASKNGNLLTVVAVPYHHIGSQWIDELKPMAPIFVTGQWKKHLGEALADSVMGRRRNLTLVVVRNIASSDYFLRQLELLSSHFENTLFVADEVHWFGAPSLQSALIDFANYRLGLSATPKRYFDDAGTEVLTNYFNEVVFKFPIEKALEARDERGERILTPYRYHPIFVELTVDESESYWGFTRQILAIKGKKKKEEEDWRKLETLYRMRADIGKQAENKIESLRLLLEDFPLPLKRTLIYCANFAQMEKVKQILSGFEVFPQKVTGDEKTSTSKAFNNKSERAHILESFEAGELDVLLAIDCLDEGVDIPSAQVGIILASSGNEKEFIQRRGRLMRVSDGKEVADIFDFCVVPAKTDGGLGMNNLLRVELSRIKEFADCALNKEEVLRLVNGRLEALGND